MFWKHRRSLPPFPRIWKNIWSIFIFGKMNVARRILIPDKATGIQLCEKATIYRRVGVVSLVVSNKEINKPMKNKKRKLVNIPCKTRRIISSLCVFIQATTIPNKKPSFYVSHGPGGNPGNDLSDVRRIVARTDRRHRKTYALQVLTLSSDKMAALAFSTVYI